MTGVRPKLRNGEQQKHNAATVLTDSEKRKLDRLCGEFNLNTSATLRLIIERQYARYFAP